MPIYAYRCQSCGHSKDVLQKVSDPALVECPECHQPTFAKQLTAAGFHLKGTGWYVTDFKNPQKPAAKPAESSASSSTGSSTASTGGSGSGGASGSGEKAA